MAAISFKDCFSEFLGTFALIFFGNWLNLLALAGKIEVVGVGIGFAALLTTFIWVSGKYAPCHFNPSVTVGFFAARKISVFVAVLYVTSQILGALLGYLICSHSVPNSLNEFSDPYQRMPNFGAPQFDEKIGSITIYFFEFLGASLLTGFVMSLSDSKRLHAYAPVVGALYGICMISFGEFHSISLNPLRYLAPAIFTTSFSDVVAFTVPSLLGGVFGGVLGTGLFQSDAFEKLTDEAKNE